jgi:hypothetical protein
MYTLDSLYILSYKFLLLSLIIAISNLTCTYSVSITTYVFRFNSSVNSYDLVISKSTVLFNLNWHIIELDSYTAIFCLWYTSLIKNPSLHNYEFNGYIVGYFLNVLYTSKLPLNNPTFVAYLGFNGTFYTKLNPSSM